MRVVHLAQRLSASLQRNAVAHHVVMTPEQADALSNNLVYVAMEAWGELFGVPPWMDQICDALGWAGGTWTQVVEEVRRLRALPTELTASVPLAKLYVVLNEVGAMGLTDATEVFVEVVKRIDGAARCCPVEQVNARPFPWPAATGPYDNAGPERGCFVEAFGARFVVLPTNQSGSTSGRRLYRVICETCDRTLHRATTGPEEIIRVHEGAHAAPAQAVVR